MNSGQTSQPDQAGLRAAKHAFATNTRSVRLFGRILLAGLIVEVFVPIIFREYPSWTETIVHVLCAFAVAIGVWGEIRFGEKADIAAEELQNEAEHQVAEAVKRSGEAHERAAVADARAAEANAHAAEANAKAEEERLKRAEIEERRAPRRLSGEQFSAIVTRLRVFAPVQIGILVSSDDLAEPFGFAGELHRALSQAGCHVFQATRMDKVFMLGLWVQLAPDANDLAQRAGRELRQCLEDIGIVVDFRLTTASGGNIVGDERANAAPILLNVGVHPVTAHGG